MMTMVRRMKRRDAEERNNLEGKGFPGESSVGTEHERSILCHDRMMSTPCHLCGSEEHGTLCRMSGYGVLVGVDYICPVLSYDCWGRVTSVPGEGLKLCPHRFVRVYGYDRYLVISALLKFENVGYGRFMSPMNRKLFREEVFRLCVAGETCTCRG